jgi:hypothetical protein
MVMDHDRRSTQRKVAYLGFPTGSHNPQRLGIPPENCSVGPDTEEVTGSNPVAPTTPGLTSETPTISTLDRSARPRSGWMESAHRSRALNLLTSCGLLQAWAHGQDMQVPYRS